MPRPRRCREPRKQGDLLRRAIRDGWAIPIVARQRAVKVAQAIINDPKETARNRNMAIRMLLAMDRLALETFEEEPNQDSTINVIFDRPADSNAGIEP